MNQPTEQPLTCSSGLSSEWGGCIRYKGFVHTFYALVLPSEHFAKHPEWFSLIKGRRSTDRAQLCLTNPQLRDFVADRVKQWLREAPEASIVSVSQNDWHGARECAGCAALADAEASQAGPLIAFVNDIAQKVEPEFQTRPSIPWPINTHAGRPRHCVRAATSLSGSAPSNAISANRSTRRRT